MTKRITASVFLALSLLANTGLAESVPFTTRHKYVTPNTEVSTNVYGTVTGIVDKDYVNKLVDIPEVPVKDVQVDGVSVVGNDKIANIITTNFLAKQEVEPSEEHTGYAINAENAILATKAEYAPVLRDDSTGSIIEGTDGGFIITNDTTKKSSSLVPDGSSFLTESSLSQSQVILEINTSLSGKQDLLNTEDDIHVNSIETYSSSKTGNIIIRDGNGLSFLGVGLSPHGPLERISVFGFGGKTAFEQVNDLIESSIISSISSSNTAFSNAVLSVGLNIDTNSVAVLNEIAATFGGFPIEGTATTVGGLLAALAAAVAWLKKKTGEIETNVGAANTALEEVA